MNFDCNGVDIRIWSIEPSNGSLFLMKWPTLRFWQDLAPIAPKRTLFI